MVSHELSEVSRYTLAMSAQLTRNTVTTRLHREGHNFQVHLSIDDHGMTIQLPSGGQVVASGNGPAVSDHLHTAGGLPFISTLLCVKTSSIQMPKCQLSVEATHCMHLLQAGYACL